MLCHWFLLSYFTIQMHSMKYNKLYPVKVWLTGLSITSLLMSLAPHATEIKGTMKMTLNDFSPFFILLFCNALLLLPAFIIFYISFLLLQRRSFDNSKAKSILIAVTCISIIGYFLVIGSSSGEMLSIETMLMTLGYLLPTISCAAYYKIRYDDSSLG